MCGYYSAELPREVVGQLLPPPSHFSRMFETKKIVIFLCYWKEVFTSNTWVLSTYHFLCLCILHRLLLVAQRQNQGKLWTMTSTSRTGRLKIAQTQITCTKSNPNDTRLEAMSTYLFLMLKFWKMSQLKDKNHNLYWFLLIFCLFWRLFWLIWDHSVPRY